MKAYSDDLRERVIRLRESGESAKAIVLRLEVSERWVYALTKRNRETGSYKALPIPGRPRKLSSENVKNLLRLVEERPDATLQELKEQGNFAVSVPTIYRALRRARMTFKKNALPREAEE